MPEVAATAAPVHSTAAPGYVDEPARIPVTPWVYLSSCGTRHRPAGRDVAGLEPQHIGFGEIEPDVDQRDGAAVGECVHGLEAAEGDGRRGVHGGAGDRTGRHVDAAGGVDGDHRNLRGIDSGEHLGRRRPQRTGAGDADHTVDDEIGCRRDTIHDAAAGLPECRQPLAVGVVRAEQHRVRGRAAAAQERRRPQRVTAVVARADDRAHPTAGDAAGAGPQLADDRGGQPEGRTPHQGAIGQAGQQRRFGVADRVYAVVMPHRIQHSMLARLCAQHSLRSRPYIRL